MARHEEREELTAQMEALQARLEGLDADDEVVIEEPDGATFRLKGARAAAFLKKRSHLWEDDAPEVDDEAAAEGEPSPRARAPKQDKKPAGGGYFNKRRS